MGRGSWDRGLQQTQCMHVCERGCGVTQHAFLATVPVLYRGGIYGLRVIRAGTPPSPVQQNISRRVCIKVYVKEQLEGNAPRSLGPNITNINL